jgi:hypothetical protein
MSQTEAPPPPAAEPPPAERTCPITADFLPPNMRKHVDAKAPVPLRMMAAKSMVPLSPSDMLGALFMLTFDPDASVRETAAKTAAALPDRLAASAFRDEGLKAPVLGWFLELFAEKDVYAEMLILNATTPDESVALAARICTAKIAEIIGQNQLRVLRHEDIVRQLCQNPNASPALLDSVCDFAVRSGVVLDIPQMNDARVRLYGPEVAANPPDPGPTAEQVLEEYEGGLKDEAAAPLEEGKKLTLMQRVMKMNVSEKIKLASKGNKEARTLLLRDSNKLVAVAVVRSPRITDGEVLVIAQNRTANEEVLRIVYNNRDWTKLYTIKLALVKNPKTPLPVAMKFMNTLRESEVKDLSRNKNVPSGIQSMAKKALEKKQPGGKNK